MSNDVFSIQVTGVPEALRGLERVERNVSAGGGLGRTMRLALGMLQRYAIGVVHVQTGRLKNSIFIHEETRGNDAWGIVATNVAYAVAEHNRPGTKPGATPYAGHDFFAQTVRAEGPHVNDLFAQEMRP